jgi:hypothetical protein
VVDDPEREDDIEASVPLFGEVSHVVLDERNVREPELIGRVPGSVEILGAPLDPDRLRPVERALDREQPLKAGEVEHAQFVERLAGVETDRLKHPRQPRIQRGVGADGVAAIGQTDVVRRPAGRYAFGRTHPLVDYAAGRRIFAVRLVPGCPSMSR